jgi:hypothetical protein
MFSPNPLGPTEKKMVKSEGNKGSRAEDVVNVMYQQKEDIKEKQQKKFARHKNE